MKLKNLLLPCALLVFVGACSKATEDEETNHPWETQVEALEKAKGVEQMIQDVTNKNRQTIDESAE